MRNYQYIMVKLDAIKNCIQSGNEDWKDTHVSQLWELINVAPYIDYVTMTKDNKGYVIFGTMPSGAGMLTFKATVRASLLFGFVMTKETFLRSSRDTIKEHNRLVRESHKEYCIDDYGCDCNQIGQDDLDCFLDMIAEWLRDHVPSNLRGVKSE